MSLNDHKLKISYCYPDKLTPLHSLDAIVNSSIEFKYSFASIDVYNNTITFSNSESVQHVGSSFNGVIITSIDGSIPDFKSFSISYKANDFYESFLSVDSRNIYMNISGYVAIAGQNVVFEVNFVATAPIDIALSAATASENAAGAMIGKLSSDDWNSSDVHTYTVDDSRFVIVGDQLKLKDGVSLDFEAEPAVRLTVTSTDSSSLSFDKTFTITVTNINETPSFTGPSQLSFAENQFVIAALAATDPDGDRLSYTITGGDDAALFKIDAKTGALSFVRAPDFEAPGSAAGTNEYQVRVEVSDGSLSASKLFQVSVTDSDDQKFGTAGNDVFHAGTAFEHFFGGDGRDTVVFTGARDDYTIKMQPNGTITVAYGNGVDTLDSIERLQFRDGTLAFDTDGTAGQMFRLYQAVFGREPDAEGLSYWVRHQDASKSSFEDVARSFMASPEFAQRYGDLDSLSNSAFVTLLYQNVLGRKPDGDGFTYWVSKLDTGQTNHGDLLAFFSDSKENIAGTAGAMSEGMWLA